MSHKCGKSIDFLILFPSDTNCGVTPDTSHMMKSAHISAKKFMLQPEIICLILKNIMNGFWWNVQEILKISQGTEIWNITKMKRHSFDL